MCVGFWSLEHPEYALILCSNRDEYLSRPTSAAHFHSFEKPGDPVHGQVLSGRDLRGGGTWLGQSLSGRVAFLTNITEESRQYSSTRGELTSSFLLPDASQPTLGEHVHSLVMERKSYAGFNLLLLAPAQDTPRLAFDAQYVTNHGGGGKVTARGLTEAERCCGGLSNGIDGSGADTWPKVQVGTRLFQQALDSTTPQTQDVDLAERLFQLLTWTSDMPPRVRADLRDTIHIEPINLPLASEHSTFYGTRLSTVILVHRDGRVLFIERDMWILQGEGVERGEPKLQRVFSFQLNVARQEVDDS